MQHFGGLTLGDSLRLQDAILVEQCGTLGARPPLMVFRMAPLLVINKRSHSSLLPTPCPCWK